MSIFGALGSNVAHSNEMRDDASAAPVASAAGPGTAAAKPALAFGQAMDPWLMFAAMALSCLGLVMVFSSSAWLAREAGVIGPDD